MKKKVLFGFMDKAKRWWGGRNVLGLLFPPLCAGCERVLLVSEQALCTHCISYLDEGGEGGMVSEALSSKFWGYFPLGHASVLFDLEVSRVGLKVIHALKYRYQTDLGIFLGKYYGQVVKMRKENQVSGDLLIPIPLHKDKEIERGYNQSFQVALGLSKVLGISVEEYGLRRLKATATQTKKSREARHKNVKDVFGLGGDVSVKDKHIILVDDVITTGATLISAAQTLMEAGASCISVMGLAGGFKEVG